MHGQKNIKLL